MRTLTLGPATLRPRFSCGEPVVCNVVKVRATVAEATVGGKRIVAPLDRFTPLAAEPAQVASIERLHRVTFADVLTAADRLQA